MVDGRGRWMSLSSFDGEEDRDSALTGSVFKIVLIEYSNLLSSSLSLSFFPVLLKSLHTHASTKVRQLRSTLLSLSFLYSMKKGVWERGSYLVRDDIRRSNCSGTPSRLLPFSLQIHPQLAIFHHSKTEELDFLSRLISSQ